MLASIYNVNNPAGFDYQVLQVQKELARLSFIEAVFGVAHVQLAYRDNKTTQDKAYLLDMGETGRVRHERWYPQGRKIDQDVDLTIDDSYVSRIFFLAKDPIYTNPQQNTWNYSDKNEEIRQHFSILLHCNLNKIENLGVYMNQEQIKTSILYALAQLPKVQTIQISENIDNFWKEFSQTQEINGFARYPFYVLRLECECMYFPFPYNGKTDMYDPSQNYDPALNITPNEDTGHANIN